MIYFWQGGRYVPAPAVNPRQKTRGKPQQLHRSKNLTTRPSVQANQTPPRNRAPAHSNLLVLLDQRSQESHKICPSGGGGGGGIAAATAPPPAISSHHPLPLHSSTPRTSRSLSPTKSAHRGGGVSGQLRDPLRLHLAIYIIPPLQPSTPRTLRSSPQSSFETHRTRGQGQHFEVHPSMSCGTTKQHRRQANKKEALA